MHRTSFNNSWFTIENQKEAVSAIAQNMLRTESWEAWAALCNACRDGTPNRRNRHAQRAIFRWLDFTTCFVFLLLGIGSR